MSMEPWQATTSRWEIRAVALFTGESRSKDSNTPGTIDDAAGRFHHREFFCSLRTTRDPMLTDNVTGLERRPRAGGLLSIVSTTTEKTRTTRTRNGGGGEEGTC